MIWRGGHSKEVLDSLPTRVQAHVLHVLEQLITEPAMLENLTARGRSAGGKDRYYVPMLIDDVRWTVLVERKKLVDFPSKMVLALVLVIAVDAATNE